MIPKYADTIVVAVIYNHQLTWYVSDKELWFLDTYKLRDAYKEIGISIEEGKLPHHTIPIVDVNNAPLFLELMKHYQVDTNYLSTMLLDVASKATSWEEVVDLCPVLLINFDAKTLISSYPEDIRFENYIPDGWAGTYDDFYNLIPEKYRFWVVEGKNYFQLFE